MNRRRSIRILFWVFAGVVLALNLTTLVVRMIQGRADIAETLLVIMIMPAIAVALLTLRAEHRSGRR